METAVQQFDLKPPIATTVTRDIPELGVKQGDKVTLNRATLDASRARFGENRMYLLLADYALSTKEIKTLQTQANEHKREIAIRDGFRSSVPRRYQRAY